MYDIEVSSQLVNSPCRNFDGVLTSCTFDRGQMHNTQVEGLKRWMEMCCGIVLPLQLFLCHQGHAH